MKPLRYRRHLPIIFSATALAVSLVLQPVIYAISAKDLHSIEYGTPFYDAQENCYDSSGLPYLVGSNNAEKAFLYLRSQGLSPTAAAGIVGNLIVESGGVNPRLVQAYKDHPEQQSDTIPAYASGVAGYGIAQWQTADRQQGLIDDANNAGRQPGDLGVQLDYLWKEATSAAYASVLQQVKAATSVQGGQGSTQLWMNGYEKPNPDPTVSHPDIRDADALRILSSYGSDTVPTSCTGSTDFVNNFIEYKQCDDAKLNIHPSWANDKYDGDPHGNATVCDGGCGPSAMAMIITNLTGQKVTPTDTAAYGMAHGTAEAGGGSSWTVGPVLAQHWNLDIKEIGSGVFDVDAINKTLRNGGLVLFTGRAYALPFSSAGHFIVIRAVTDSGKWLIGTSMTGIGNTINKEYDPYKIKADLDAYHDAANKGQPHFNSWEVTLKH